MQTPTRKSWLSLVVLAAALYLPQAATAQQHREALVSVTLDSARVDTLIQVLEQQTGVHFYYDTAQTDTLKITLSVKDQPLEQVLALALDRTGLFYAFDDKGNVFLSRGYALDLGVPTFTTADTGGGGKKAGKNDRPEAR